MNIRAKALYILGVIFLSFTAVLVLLTYLVLTRGYLDIEHQQAERNMLVVENTLANQFETLTRVAVDWGHWDDTYNFVLDLNGAYIEANLGDDALANLDLNMMLYINNDRELVYAKHVDLETWEETPPPDLDHVIYPGSPVLDLPDEQDHVRGFFQTSGGVVQFVSVSILTNDSTGPRNGTLVLGRYFDAARVQRLSNSLQLPIAAYTLGEANAALGSDTASQVIARAPAALMVPHDETNLSVYTLIRDISNNPLLVLEIQLERSIYQQGITSIVQFSALLAVFGLVFIIVILLLMEKVILMRVIAIHRFISEIRDSGNLSLRLISHGRDEIAKLAENLNQMVVSLAQSHNLLEERVKQRTQELEQSNLQLQNEITERRQAQVELVRARDQALDALRLKTQILANVSHDVRTPLNIITMSAEMLGYYGTLNDRQQQKINQIVMNAQQLVSFFNNLLEEAQSQTNQIEIHEKPFQPQQMLNTLNNTLEPLARHKGLSFTAELDPEMPPTIYGDYERVMQILSNMVNNAIKFTQQGSVHIKIKRPDARHWQIEVADTGPGIAEKDQESIFEAFWQVDGSMTREINRGVGLGLSIVKHLTTMMGGEIQLDSQPGKGSVFTITLPLNVREEAS